MKIINISYLLSFVLGAIALWGGGINCKAQVNAEQVTAIGRNVLAMDDYMLAIHYFNLAIKAKDYLAEPYFFRALAKLRLEDYGGAEADCTTALNRSKYLTDAYKLRGFARQQLGKDSLAIEDFDYGLTQNPGDRDLMLFKAFSELNLKRYEQADSSLTNLIANNSKLFEAVTARAQLRIERGDTVGALEDVERTLEISPTQEYPYILRAQIYSDLQDWPNASVAMNDVVRLFPDKPELYLNRAFIRYKADDYFGAMNDYNEALHLDPYNEAAIFNRALLRLEVMELDGAAEDFSRVLELDPNNFYALYNRFLIYYDTKQYAKAEPDIRRIIKRYPRFYPAYYALAQIRYERGDEKGAVKNMLTADEIVRKYVDNPKKNPLDRPTISPHANKKGFKKKKDAQEDTQEDILEKFNQLVTAEIENDQTLSFNDKYKGKVQDRETSLAPEPLFQLSLLAPEQSLKAEGNYFRELSELNSHNYIAERIYLKEDRQPLNEEEINLIFEHVEKYTAALTSGKPRTVDYIARGTAYTMLRNYESALADFNSALELMPDYSVALMGKGYAAAMLMKTENMADPRAVIDIYDKALAQNPMLVFAWFNKGNIYYDNQAYQQAEESFTKAIEQNAELGQAYYNRGLARMQQGKRNEAFEDFSKAGELGILQGYRVMKSLR